MLNHPELIAWQKTINDALLGATIEKITCYQVNPTYLVFDPERLWVLDAGIEITSTGGEVFSYCWNNEMDLMDFISGSASQLLDELDYYDLNDVTSVVQAALEGKTIAQIDFEWNWYQRMNEDFELEDQLNFAPLGIVFKFTDGGTLQLASIQFGVANQTLAHAKYLPEGDLMISLNEVIPIHLESTDEEE
jgi:hypothetical protein